MARWRRTYNYDQYSSEDSDYSEEEVYNTRKLGSKPKRFLSQIPLTQDDGSLLRAGLPSSYKPWVSTAQNGDTFSLKKIPTTDPVFKDILDIIKSNGDIKRITITSIERVICPYIRALYELKKLEIKEKYKKEVKEYDMFHGTKNHNSDGICSMNFNYRLCGLSRGTKYGQGVSFSPYFFYAKCFCNKKPNDEKTIFLCNVICMRSQIGTCDTVYPSLGYDTTCREKGEVFVKYEDDSFIPKYKIKFILKH